MSFKTFISALIVLHLFLNVSGQITFSDEIRIPCTDIKDQGGHGNTGTCWCFSTTSFLESELIRMGKEEINLSEMYTVRHIYLDKAQNYILRQGEARFGKGALAHDALRSVQVNGLVPEEIYPTTKTDADSLDHRELFKGMKAYLDAVIETGYPSKNWMNAFNGVLDAYMGKVPNSFTFNNKAYTPKSYAEGLGFDINNYINITSFNHHPFYGYFILEIPDNYSNGRSFNVKLNEMMDIINLALEKGFTLIWAGDVGEKGYSPGNGIAVLPVDINKDNLLSEPYPEIEVNQHNRQNCFMSYQTTDDHGLHLIGRAKDKDENTYYILKDSHGLRGPFKGYVYMSESYLKMKTISIILHKNALPNNITTQL